MKTNKDNKIKLTGVRRVIIKGEYIRLDALLKYASVVSSGGEAKVLIQSGEVYVGDQVCTMRGKKIIANDVIRVGRDILVVKQEN